MTQREQEIIRRRLEGNTARHFGDETSAIRALAAECDRLRAEARPLRREVERLRARADALAVAARDLLGAASAYVDPDAQNQRLAAAVARTREALDAHPGGES